VELLHGDLFAQRLLPVRRDLVLVVGPVLVREGRHPPSRRLADGHLEETLVLDRRLFGERLANRQQAMSTRCGSSRRKVGDEIAGPVRIITSQRIEWYDGAMLSAAANELRQVDSNIHTDPDFARKEGFDQVNADGMIMTNWCSELMVKAFGIHYLERGELMNKYIKPVHLGTSLHVKRRVPLAAPMTSRGPIPSCRGTR